MKVAYALPNTQKEENLCAGYERAPHIAIITLYRQNPDGTKNGLCKVCATRFLLSDDEWPEKTGKCRKEST